MNRHVLLVGFHFPPSAVSSGHLRTLGFARYLPEYGWKPVVLSTRSGTFSRTDPASISQIPQHCIVYRAPALDVRKYFGVRGRYPSILAQPDRWASWWLSAVPLGLRLIKRYDIRAIWSTYPIMTSHCIAATLARLTNLPWVAEFRDPVVPWFPGRSRYSAASQLRWEERIARTAEHVVFTAPGAMRQYAAKYPGTEREHRMSVITNGYDESEFENLPLDAVNNRSRPIRIVHSGLLYPDGRNPVPFLRALAQARETLGITAQDLQVTLRASGSETSYRQEIVRLGLTDVVTLAPKISYRESLAEQIAADGFLLFQGEKFDHQIPAKVYDYLRIGRPILALVGPTGDTASFLRSTGGAQIVPIDNIKIISEALTDFLGTLRSGHKPDVDWDLIRGHSRTVGARALAEVLSRVTTKKEGSADVHG